MSSLNQSNTARYLAQFGSALLKTKCVERSNSVRHRLWRVLTETVARHRLDIPEQKYVIDLLRETGPFDRQEGRFRHAVRDTLICIGRSPKVVEIAETLLRFAQDAQDERIFELAGEAMARKIERQQVLGLAGEILRQDEARDRLHRELAKI